MKSILIIEDDPDILFILTHILEEKGYKICQVDGITFEAVQSLN